MGYRYHLNVTTHENFNDKNLVKNDMFEKIKEISECCYAIENEKGSDMPNDFYGQPDDFTLFRITRESLLLLIELYKSEYENFLENQLKKDDIYDSHFNYKMEIVDIKNMLNFDSEYLLSNSTYFNISIYDLMYLYKTFDFDKKVLFVTGY